MTDAWVLPEETLTSWKLGGWKGGLGISIFKNSPHDSPAQPAGRARCSIPHYLLLGSQVPNNLPGLWLCFRKIGFAVPSGMQDCRVLGSVHPRGP